MMHLSPSQRRRQRAINAQAEEDAQAFDLTIALSSFLTLSTERSISTMVRREQFGNRRVPRIFTARCRPQEMPSGHRMILAYGEIECDWVYGPEREAWAMIALYNDKFGPPPQRGENRGPR